MDACFVPFLSTIVNEYSTGLCIVVIALERLLAIFYCSHKPGDTVTNILFKVIRFNVSGLDKIYFNTKNIVTVFFTFLKKSTSCKQNFLGVYDFLCLRFEIFLKNGKCFEKILNKI